MPQIVQQEPGEDVFEAMYRTAEDFEAVFKARDLPTLQQVFQLLSAWTWKTRRPSM
jgi:hypothetical protein